MVDIMSDIMEAQRRLAAGGGTPMPDGGDALMRDIMEAQRRLSLQQPQRQAPMMPQEEPGWGETIGRGLVSGTESILGGIAAGAQWAGEVAGLPATAEHGRVGEEFWRKRQEQDQPQFQGTFTENPSIKRAVGIVSQAVPFLGATVLTGGAAGAAGLGLGAATAAAVTTGALLENAPAYSEARRAGKGVGSASASAGAATVGTALLDVLPISRFLKGFKGGLGARMAKGALAEGVTEPMQQVWQNLVAKIGYDKTRSLWEGVVESIIGGVGAGGLAGGVFKENTFKDTSPGHTTDLTGYPKEGARFDMTELDVFAAEAIKAGADPADVQAAIESGAEHIADAMQQPEIQAAIKEKITQQATPEAAPEAQPMGPAEESAAVFERAFQEGQAPTGREGLARDLAAQEAVGEQFRRTGFTPAPVAKSAEESAAVLEAELGRLEAIRQSIMGQEGLAGQLRGEEVTPPPVPTSPDGFLLKPDGKEYRWQGPGLAKAIINKRNLAETHHPMQRPDGSWGIMDNAGMEAQPEVAPEVPAPPPVVPMEVQTPVPEDQQPTPAPIVAPEAPPVAAKEPPRPVVTQKPDTGTSVSVPMSAKQAEGLAPKEQKKFLVAEIDKAIEAAPDDATSLAVIAQEAVGPAPENPHAQGGPVTEQEKEAYSAAREEWESLVSRATVDALRDPANSVTIEVPGDGSFTIINTKRDLAEFKKKAKSFPVTIPKKPSVSRPITATTPIGNRIKGFAGRYYNKFRPRNQRIIENKPSYTDDGVLVEGQYYNPKTGWYTDRKMLVLLSKKPKLKYPARELANDMLANILPDQKNLEQTTLLAEVFDSEGSATDKVFIHAVSASGVHTLLDAESVDAILTQHPNAKTFLKEEASVDSPVIFKVGGKVVGMAMPFRIEDKFKRKLEELLAENKDRVGFRAPQYARTTGPQGDEQETPKPGEEPQYSMVGQKAYGANRDALRSARSQEQAGFPIDEIRQNTGWFRGIDKKWRFEIGDENFGVTPKFESLPESPIFGKKQSITLREAIDHPALFRAYPALRDVKIFKGRPIFDFFKSQQGWFNEKTNEIGITPYAENMPATVIHEIQHWIQMKEGFAQGGNLENAIENASGKRLVGLAKRTVESLEKDIKSQKKRLDENKAILKKIEGLKSSDMAQLQTFVDEFYRIKTVTSKKYMTFKNDPNNAGINYFVEGPGRSFFDLKQSLLRSIQELLGVPLVSKYLSAVNDIGAHKKKISIAERSIVSTQKQIAELMHPDSEDQLRKLIKSTGRVNFEAYQSLAGEIEARDTAERLKLTKQERVGTTPYESQGIEPEDAIVVFNGGGESFQMNANYARTTGPQGDAVTSDDIRDIWKGQNIGRAPDGSMWVVLKNGKGFTVKTVKSIAEDRVAVAATYGKAALKDDAVIVGATTNDTIYLVRDLAGKWTFAHESEHMLERMGLLYPMEIFKLRADIKKMAKQGKWDPVNPEDIGGGEDRANFIADMLTKPRPDGVLGKMMDRIQEFIDRLVNLVHRTSRGIVRDIRSGAVAGREGPGGALGGGVPQFDTIKPWDVNTPRFKKWFGNSKVVDSDGKPLVVYKGMYPRDYNVEPEQDIEVMSRPGPLPAFNKDEKGVDIIGFFGGKDVANRFAGLLSESAVFPVYLKIENPFIIDANGELAGNIQFGESGKPFRDAIRSKKYDGVIIKNTRDEGTLYVPTDSPTQVKSIWNRGTWDPADPRIQYATLREQMQAAQRALGISKAVETAVAEDPDTASFNRNLDQWFVQKDYKVHVASVEAKVLQDKIKEVLGVKWFRKPAQDIDAAIHIHLALKEDPTALDEYGDQLTAEQRRIVDMAQNVIPSNPKLMAIANYISEQYRQTGLEGLDKGVIFNVLDNYVGRAWKRPEGKGPSTEQFTTFKPTSRHAKPRVFSSILEGWAKGHELAITGATNNLNLIKDEINRAIEDKDLIKRLMETKTEDGNPLLMATRFGAPEGYKQLKGYGFTTWSPGATVKGGKAKGTYVNEEGRRIFIGKNARLITRYGVMKKGGKRAVKVLDTEQEARAFIESTDDPGDYAITERSTVYERVPLYAKEEMANRLNKITTSSKLKGLKPIDIATKYNAVLKSYVLSYSFFHHLAFTRSYLLGTTGKTREEWNPIKAWRMGQEAIKNLNPELKLLVENELTLGRQQEWEESIFQQQDTVVGRAIDKLGPIPKAIKNRINELHRMHTDFLFKNWGAGLKAQAALIEYRNALKRHPDMDPNERARMVAKLINADFGGLHLQRMERDPTLQHIARLFLLAPDWTESNVRTMYKAIKAGGKEETAMYRRFWASVLTKGFTAVIAMNLLLAGMDDDDFIERFQKAWRAGNMRWIDVDVTPIYKAMGGREETRKYLGVFGHFRDPMKFISHPIRSLHHKGSNLYKIFHEAMVGADWKGQRFTSLDELFGVDDKGLYLTNTRTHRAGDPKGGKLRFKLVSPSRSTGPIGLSQVPSYVAAQARGSVPIPIQNLLGAVGGEIEAWDAVLRSVGMHSSTTYPTKTNVTRDLVNEVVTAMETTNARDKAQRMTDVRKRIAAYNRGKINSGERDKTIPMTLIISRAKKTIKANRIARLRRQR